MIPGANLLGMAARLIRLQPVEWRRNRGAIQVDGAGLDESNFDPPLTIKASVQAVPRSVIVREGLDLQQNYLMVYTEKPLQDLRRDRTPDLLYFGGRVYNVESNTSWKLMDGWLGAIVIDTGPA